MKSNLATKRSLLALAVMMPCVTQAVTVDVIATQTVTTTPFGTNVRAITTNTTWTKDNVYLLKDKVFVTNGATLTIEPGTKIYSTLDTKGTGTKDDDAFGSLIITRGSKIHAAGTAEAPIVFTTVDELEYEQQDDFDGDGLVADAPGVTTAGRWGGVVILGSAPIANYNASGNIGENRIEGFQPAASADLDADGRADVIEYGGVSSSDNSGVFRYVSIRHGGYVYSGANEINGLTLGGVGSGTQIDHVEVYANADDGVEFFGGTVSANYLVMAFNQDDSFDIDEGYVATNQFWFAVQAPTLADGILSGHDNGGEWDGVVGTIGDYATNSAPILFNATFVGSGTTAATGNDKGNNAIFIDDRFKGKVYNSVFDDFREHLIENSGDGVGSGLEFGHNTVGRFGAGTVGNNLSYINGAANTFYDGAGNPLNGNSAGGVNPQYSSYKRNAQNELEVLDPRPVSGSPLWVANGATLQAGAPVATSYRGAFGSENWAAGWTKTSEALFFTNKVDVVAEQAVTTTAFGANVKAINTNTTWTKDKVYLLKDKVFVTNGATLTIEAGTKVYATLDDNNTPLVKDDDLFGALVITRGSKILAEGTAEEPIVFTTVDELEHESNIDFDGDGLIAEAPTVTTAGRWGGLVVLGAAPIANFNASGNIGENRIEGFQPAASVDLDADGRADVIEYGGTNTADDSGIIRYVSIRHGGYVYSGANEINGLTLGGVGSGTKIDHVEVYANADDGVEFFGGTVSANYLVMAFNQDDSFDIDEGYAATNQFWFAVQAPALADGVSSGHDNGGEWDGVVGTIGDYAVNSAPVLYNATFLGAGTGSFTGNDKGNNAIFIDDRFRGKVYNSVFDDFREHLLENSGDGVGTGLEFAFNTIGRFGGGNYNGSNASNLSYLNGTGTANLFFDASGSPIHGNSNGGVNPKWSHYVRDEDQVLVALDPRPATGSPLWVGANQLKPGAPVTTSFRGAFGRENWAAGWTKLSQSGVLLGEVSTGSGGGPTLAADTDGDGISDAVEAANTALGFNPTVSNGSVSSVFSGLYTASTIQDLRGTGVLIQADATEVNLTLPLEKSTGLETWAPAGNLTLTLPKTQGKEFYRIQIPD